MADETRSAGAGTLSPTLVDSDHPDAETVSGDAAYEERYDSDFTYLTKEKPKDSVEEGQKEGAEPPATTEEHTPEGKKEEPKIDVPPIDQTTEPPKKEEPKTAAPLTDDKVGYEKRYKDLQAYSDSTIDGLKKELATLKTENETLASLKVVKEEVERNPHAFLTKYYPQLAEQLNPQKLAVEQLKKEFGAEFDSYNASEALQEGTTSFKIQQRLDELKNQAQRDRLEAEISRREDSRKREELLSASRDKVKKTYGLSDEQFQKEIVEYAKSLPPNFETIAKVRYFDWHIQKAVDQALRQNKRGAPENPPASIAGEPGHTGDEDTASPGYKELSNEFGDMS